MREKLKNDLILLLDKYVDVDVLRQVGPQIEIILSNIKKSKKQNRIIDYNISYIQ